VCVYGHITISKSRENERKKENGKMWVVFTKEKRTTLKNIDYTYFASFTNSFRAKIVILINLE